MNTVINKKSFEAFVLDWDTNYFNVKSAKVILKDNLSKNDKKEILEYCNNFEFITISNLNNNSENNIWIAQKTKSFLADMNVQFIKNIDKPSIKMDKFTNVYNLFPENEDLLNISKKSFLYSRFFNDPYLPKEKSQNIYLQWTKNSFNKLEKYFVITKINEKIAGYILFSMNLVNSFAIIELIAVDEKFRGKGIGKSLMTGLENFTYEKGVKVIRVGTQVDNISAIRFYNTCGFKYLNCNSIYHYWPNII
jgi:ribosomal protein S18 acetylase RimI-like enzyme